MPFAQWGYPHAEGSVEQFEKAFPAQFICEAIDQTRGWFYTLMAVNTLVHGRSSYENVLCLGHIVAEDGRKMSKHLGNILLPMPLMEDHGADALRWFMAASGSPWLQRRVGHGVLQEIVRKTLLTYWNTASFLTLYGNANDWSPLETPVPDVSDRPVLDRWLLSETHRLVQDGHRRLRGLRHPAGGAPAGRARRRHVQLVRTPVAAPVLGGRPVGAGHAARVPLRGDAAARAGGAVRDRAGLAGRRAPGLAGRAGLGAPGPWPQVDGALVDETLAAQVALVRRVVELGRSARAESKVRNRQPLGRALVAAPGWDALPDELRRQVADELNVVASASWPASWSTAAPRATSGPSASGSARTPRRWPLPSQRRTPVSWPPRCGPGRPPRWSWPAPTSR
jgi:isoleucyl-tRNA synthetase